MAKLTVLSKAGTQNIVSNVVINAPLAKVFHAYTDGEMVAKWWCQGEPMEIAEYEPVSGGKYRFITPGQNGEKDAFHGCFHLVKKDECIIQTFEYEGLPEYGFVALERADFKKIDDESTEISIVTTFQSEQQRNAMVEGGMEDGFRESINALGTIVEQKL